MNGAACTCKQMSPQAVSKLFFWISTDSKANMAWKNGQCKRKGKILIHIPCPKHRRANSQNFYSAELYHIKKQNDKNKNLHSRLKTLGEREVSRSLKTILKLLSKTNSISLLFFFRVCCVELWGFLLVLIFFWKGWW